jgi:hypothetical protein
MECAVCKRAVEDFVLLAPSNLSTQTTTREPSTDAGTRNGNHTDMAGKSFMDPLDSPTSSSGRRGTKNAARTKPNLLPSALESGIDGFIDQGSFFDGARGASTPVGGRPSLNSGDNVVLRVDNVPWVGDFP